MGAPKGNFPTFRCNDGSLPDLEKLCPELEAGWIKDKLGRNYTRMLSRQIYTYGVIFHMTGSKEAFDAMKAGVDYLRKHRIDRENGGAFSWVDQQGKPGLNWKQRTTQDLAYAQLGLAFYYYLTRDAAVLADIEMVKQHIFSHYWDPERKQLRWALQDSEENKAGQQELVAQLDQINAYMLMLLPVLPEPMAQAWRSDLRRLIDALLTHYHAEAEQRFYGYIHHQSGKATTARHADRGHTIKAYWMIYLAARELGDTILQKKAEKGMRSVLEAAYLQLPLGMLFSEVDEEFIDLEVGVWNAYYNGTGAAWWQYAELDQAAQTLALLDTTMYDYLIYTYDVWFGTFVDREKGGILPWAKGYQGAKNHFWKNGYHGAEHALIGYLGACQHQGETAELWFAFAGDQPRKAVPYLLQGEAKLVSEQQGFQRYQFTGVR